MRRIRFVGEKMRRLLLGSVVLAIALGDGGATAAQEEEPPVAGTFSPAGSLIEPRTRHSAVPLPDGRVFVVGGEGIHSVVPDEDGDPETIHLIHLHTAEVWDPATGMFEAVASHSACHAWYPAMLLPDGRVINIGHCFPHFPDSAEIWDPETGAFSPPGIFEAAPRYGPRVVLPDGRILFVGGMGIEEVPSTAEAVIWDPQTASFTPTGSLGTLRGGHTATLLPDGRVLVVGGMGPSDSDTASAELWDLVSGTFEPAGSLVDGPRIYHTAALLDDGRVLVVGGLGADGPLVSAEVWDPETASFGLAGSLTTAREAMDASHTATLLPDGRVLVVGGHGSFDGGGPLASAELWDPATMSFGPAGSLAQARWNHTATLMPDGRVLVVGGLGAGEDEFLASAEFWAPIDGLVVPATLGIGGPSPALAQDDGGPAADSTPILDALSLLPSDIDTFEFTHWSALTSAHGGADVTSASSLAERQRLVLEIARSSEATTFPLGLDRLATWSERWGWHTTDLEWQASCCYAPDFTILRFREDWDPEPFMARLESDGYERRDRPHATSFTLDPDAEAPDRDYLERVFETEGATGGPMGSRASVAVSPDGHTVVLASGPDAHKILKLAARADPEAIVAGPFGRVATALGRPFAAQILDGQPYGCSGTGEEHAYFSEEQAPLAQAVGVLNPYQAFGFGYERAGPGEPAVGRYVFAYKRAKDARADLLGRRTLIDEGYSRRHGAPYRATAFTLLDAGVEGRQLILDVALVDDSPQTLFDQYIGRSLVFAICG